MAKLTMDTDSLRNVGEDLKAISNDYKTIMDGVYNKIKSIPEIGIWISDNTNNSANKFVDVAIHDIENNKELHTSIEKLGDQIYKYGNSINQIADNKFEEGVWEK